MEVLKKKQNVKCEEKSLIKSTSKHGPLKLFTVKVSGLGYKHLKKHIKQFFRPLVPKSIRIPRKIKGIAYLGFKKESQMKKALLKNKSFLGKKQIVRYFSTTNSILTLFFIVFHICAEGKQIFVSKYEQKEESNENSSNKTNVKWKKQEEMLKDEESIAESGRMFIRNLTYTTTEDDVRKLFEKYGKNIFALIYCKKFYKKFPLVLTKTETLFKYFMIFFIVNLFSCNRFLSLLNQVL